MTDSIPTETNSTDELLREIGIAEATADTAMRKAKAYINYQRSVIADLIQYLPKDHPYQPGFQEAAAGGFCEDCPPVGYPTDKTRCDPCPRSSGEPAWLPEDDLVKLHSWCGSRMEEEADSPYEMQMLGRAQTLAHEELVRRQQPPEPRAERLTIADQEKGCATLNDDGTWSAWTKTMPVVEPRAECETCHPKATAGEQALVDAWLLIGLDVKRGLFDARCFNSDEGAHDFIGSFRDPAKWMPLHGPERITRAVPLPICSVPTKATEHAFQVGDPVTTTWPSSRKDVGAIKSLPHPGGQLYVIRWPDGGQLCVAAEDIRRAAPNGDDAK